MGSIEIQVFVSLVVILGAAFVALICDFLKGSNEQLREANIIMRVKDDERDKRDDLVEKVQRQTIEAVAKVQGGTVGKPLAAPAPVARPTVPLNIPVVGARELFERAQMERSSRGRRSGRRSEEKPPVRPASRTDAPAQSPAVASWAQDIVIRKYQETEPVKPPAVETAPAAAAQVPVAPKPMPIPVPAAQATSQEFVGKPAEAVAPAAALKQTEAKVPMAPAAPLHQTPVAAPVAQAVPSYSHLTAPDVRDLLQKPAQAKQEETPTPGLIEVQQPLAVTPVSSCIAPATGILQPAQPESACALPRLAHCAAVELGQAGTLPLAPVTAAAMSAVPVQLEPAALSAEAAPALPALSLHAEVPEFEIIPPAVAVEATVEEEEPQVVRIRVLSDDDVLPVPEPAQAPLTQDEPAMQPAAQPETQSEAEPVVVEMVAETQPEAVIEPEIVVAEIAATADPAIQPEVVVPIETAAEPSIWLPGAEPSSWSTQSESAPVEAVAADDPFSYRPSVPEPVAETAQPAPAEPPVIQGDLRSKVVEMRSAAQARLEQEVPAGPSLALPGGFHEPTALARLLEDETPFSGLVIAVSVVDYVRLMADQGKPAIEQIMGSVTRLVMSLTREQDFACRIAEDEFVLIFGRETGASGNRRIQLVSERLWDYQLRSLGSVSIIFSWGAAESQQQPIVQAVESAREQMLETRRNRRNLTGVSRRFGRQAANS